MDRIDEVKYENNVILVRWEGSSSFEKGSLQSLSNLLKDKTVSSTLFTKSGIDSCIKVIKTIKSSLNKKSSKDKLEIVKKNVKQQVKNKVVSVKIDKKTNLKLQVKTNFQSGSILLRQPELGLIGPQEKVESELSELLVYAQQVSARLGSVSLTQNKPQVMNDYINISNEKDVSNNQKLTWDEFIKLVKNIDVTDIPEGKGFNREVFAGPDWLGQKGSYSQGALSDWSFENAIKDNIVIGANRFRYNNTSEYKRGVLADPRTTKANEQAYIEYYKQTKKILALQFAYQLYDECHNTNFANSKEIVNEFDKLFNAYNIHGNKNPRKYTKLKIDYSMKDVKDVLEEQAEYLKTHKQQGKNPNFSTIFKQDIKTYQLRMQIVAQENLVRELCNEPWFKFVSETVKNKADLIFKQQQSAKEEYAVDLDTTESILKGIRNRWTYLIHYLRTYKWKVQEKFLKYSNSYMGKDSNGNYVRIFPNADYFKQKKQVENRKNYRRRKYKTLHPEFSNENYRPAYELKQSMEDNDWKLDEETGYTIKELEQQKRKQHMDDLLRNAKNNIDLSLKSEINAARKNLNPKLIEAKKNFKADNYTYVDRQLRALGLDTSKIRKNMKSNSISKIGVRTTAVVGVSASEVKGITNIFEKPSIIYQYDKQINKYWRIDAATGEKMSRPGRDENGNEIRVTLKPVDFIPKQEKQTYYRRVRLRPMKVSVDLLKNRVINLKSNCVIIATFIQLLVSNTPLDERYKYISYTTKVSSKRAKYTKISMVDEHGYKANEEESNYLGDEINGHSDVWSGLTAIENGSISNPTKKVGNYKPTLLVRGTKSIFKEVVGSFKLTTYAYEKVHEPDNDVVRDDWIFTFKGIEFYSKNFDKSLFEKKGDQKSILEIADILYEMTKNIKDNKVGFSYKNINKRWEILEYGGYKNNSEAKIGPMYRHGVINHHSYQAPNGFLRLTEALWNKWVDSGRIYTDTADFLNAKNFDVSETESDLIKDLIQFDPSIKEDGYDYNHIVKEV